MPGSPSRQPSPSRIGRATRTAITRFLDLFPHSTRREPTIARGRDGGHYQSRHLNVSLNHLISLRASTIRAVLEEFEPDVLIVDKVPRGAVRELDPSLELLHERGRTRCVLGLRDVLDHAGAVHREWS